MKCQKACILLALTTSLISASCADADSDDQLTTPSVYEFESRFEPGQDSVSYSGQTFRQILIEDLKAYMGEMDTLVDGGTWTPANGEVVEALETWFKFDSSIAGDQDIRFSAGQNASQSTYNQVSEGKDLVQKLAGNDSATDHKDFTSEFGGWSDASIAAYGGSIDSPEGLITAFFETVEEQTLAKTNGIQPTAPDGTVLPVYITPEGLDLRQLSQKFLLGAVNFSQGADDYLDDDVSGKGLLSENDSAEEDKPYTALEHAWDEGFGYFGAHRHGGEMTAEEVAGKGGRGDRKSGIWDANGDGQVDLKSEVSFGAAINAAKRDFASAESSPTHFSRDAYEGFIAGRALIARANGPLDDAALETLKAHRDQIVGAWESAYAATMVHYINETLEHMSAIGTPEYDFAAHATAWSELKGFALCFQFNPRSAVSDSDFAKLHALLGDAPIHAGHDVEEQTSYSATLLEARALLGNAFGFSQANLEKW